MHQPYGSLCVVRIRNDLIQRSELQTVGPTMVWVLPDVPAIVFIGKGRKTKGATRKELCITWGFLCFDMVSLLYDTAMEHGPESTV